MSMLWCGHCKQRRPTQRDSQHYICCDVFGKVIYDDFVTEEETLVKGPGGESRRAGHHVKIPDEYSDSLRRTLDKGEDEIRHIVLMLNRRESIIQPASRIYTIALHRNFTRCRRTPHIAAACLYIACRTAEAPKPYLLRDFSETLAINVYVLGFVFLQLCQLLSLAEHALIKRRVDPTLFIPRFTERLAKLLNGRNVEFSRTATHIIASMKRHWMQKGRKPSGLCCAALYISALAHGFKFSKSDIVNGYLNNEEEMRYKKIIWEEMQAAKMEAGEGLSAPKPKKERRQKHDPNTPPAQTAAEAAHQMLSKKAGPDKKTKVSGHDDENDDVAAGKSPGGKESKSELMDKENEFGEEYMKTWKGRAMRRKPQATNGR